MLSRLLLVVLSVGLAACSSPVSTGSVADVVRINGITYLECSHVAACTSGEIQVGQEYARVVRRISPELAESDYRLGDGEATVLDAGTPLHTVIGHPPELRLAAQRQAEILVYMALERAAP